MSTAHQSRNPIFNSNRFKLGTFATNTIGTYQSVAPEIYVPGWESALRNARLADRAGFEALLGLARWRTPGAVPIEGRSHVVLDSFTWSAALAMATEYTALIATSHAPTVHPLVIAKQCATIDNIAGGRFALNVVGGWNRPEFDMFGIDLLPHDQRYDYLEEWIGVIYKLWSATEEFDFDGKFLKLKGALSRPQPVQRPRIPVLNAGMSMRGRRFACQYADICFVNGEVPADEVKSYKKMAREEFGRDVGVWMLQPIMQRRTRQEAAEAVEYFVGKYEDIPAVDGWAAGIAAEVRTLNNEIAKVPRQVVATGGGALIGSARDIADQFEALHEKGIDGMLCGWTDYDEGVTRFVEDVLPLLEQRGLREPFKPRN